MGLGRFICKLFGRKNLSGSNLGSVNDMMYEENSESYRGFVQRPKSMQH